MDGVVGHQEVADQFNSVYSALYNSAGSQAEMEELHERIRLLIQNENSRTETEKLTMEKVKSAAVRMKPHKMDVTQGFTSDCFLHAPDILFELLSLVFKD